LAAALAFLVLLPNLIWQFNHDFPVVSHMKELTDSQLVNMKPVTFLTEQLLMVFPGTLILLPGIFLLLFGSYLKDYRVFGYFSILVILTFLMLKGKSYYSAGIYPFLIAASAVAFEKILTRSYARILLAFPIVIPGYLALPMGKSIYEPEKLVNYFNKTVEITGTDAVRRDEDNNFNQLPQDYADMLGWNELTEAVSKAYGMVEHQGECIIFCENYGQAGAITIIGKKYNLPEPLSFSDNFKYWIPRDFQNEITTLIYINDEMGSDVKALFSDITVVGKITNPLAREYGTKVYLCQKPVESFNLFWKRVIEDI
jgi:hypothetical protein